MDSCFHHPYRLITRYIGAKGYSRSVTLLCTKVRPFDTLSQVFKSQMLIIFSCYNFLANTIRMLRLLTELTPIELANNDSST